MLTAGTARPLPGRTSRRVGAILLFTALAASGAEIGVMVSGAFTAPYLELKPRFEHETGHTVVTLATTMGVGAGSMANRLRRGEPASVVVMDDAALDRLMTEGLVLAGTKTHLGWSGIGMAVRAGAAKPDIGSIEALKRTLLQAASIAYSASISGDYLSAELFPRLRISGQVAAKSKRIERERVGFVVARGEAEIGFQQVSELLPIPGIDYVGPLPDGVQRMTLFSAAVAVKAEDPEAAARFVRFLASAEAAPVVARTGLAPAATASSPIRR